MRRTYRRGYVIQPPLSEMGPSQAYLDRSLFAQELYDDLPAGLRTLAGHYGLKKVLDAMEYEDTVEGVAQRLLYLYGDYIVLRRPKV